MKFIKQICWSITYTMLCMIWSTSCQVSPPPMFKPKPKDANLAKIKLPTGFEIDFFAKDIVNARSMCRSDNGTIFVGTRKAGNVYALPDKNGDFVADTSFLVAKGLTMPNGVAWKNGTLYVAEVSKVWAYDSIEHYLPNIPEPRLISDAFPDDTHHGWKYIAFGPDGKLYVPVGAPCNICNKEQENEQYATIMRMNDDGSDLEVYAKGIRNSVGFAWHPTTKELWFTDNGRDWLGDDMPPCELNHATEQGLHFGYPFCHGGEFSDPKFGHLKTCSEFVAPIQNLVAHVAPLGMLFYTGKQFPKSYQNQVLIAEHGSWNRSTKVGYRVSLVRLDEAGKAIDYTAFAEGWLEGKDDIWGRPVALLQLPDGSVLVSDDYGNAIYRIHYPQ